MARKKKSRRRKSHWLLFFSVILAIFILYFAGILKLSFGSAKIGNESVKIENYAFNTYVVNSRTGEKLQGFQTLNGKLYYLDPKTGAMAHGSRKIDGYDYYFTANGSDNVVKAYESLATGLKTSNSVIENTINNGLKLVGKSPYSYGSGRTSATIKKNEFDCSSFVAWMYHLGGRDLVYQDAATTSLLAQTGTLESWDDKQRGDLLITPDGVPVDEEHVAIYLGDGFILHDSVSTDGVNMSRLNQVIDPKVLGNMTWEELFKQGTVNREVN